MAWGNSYTHTLALAIDSFAASVLFNRPDLTISALCWLVTENLDSPLKLWKWQRRLLLWIGPILNKIQAGHMALARAGDIRRAKSTLSLLKEESYDATQPARTTRPTQQ